MSRAIASPFVRHSLLPAGRLQGRPRPRSRGARPSEIGQNITFTDPWTVDLTLDVPEAVEQGETIPASAIKATVTPGADATQTMQGLGVKTLEGTAATTYTFGEGGEARDVALTVPKTDVPATGTVSVDATGESTEETAPAEDVNVPVTAGDFTAELANQDGFVFKIECTAPEDATVGTVAVGDAEPPAEEPAGDAPAGEPEVPGVVQTDDAAQSATSPTAIALGGLLLAAAGASTVVVARRRTQG